MGCIQCMKKQEPVDANPNQNGVKNLFYATTEFDLSRSDDEDEEENYSLNSIRNPKGPVINRLFSISGRNLARNISQIKSFILDNLLLINIIASYRIYRLRGEDLLKVLTY
ncbi:unnamed protein product [Adineta ricciae]|uniref:Uncharacterized protein n=1 Tax=Adineta ricciae TaxID=249248 RepID=A0A814U854_ADIRI|nr:unnamed protein product [Adineta ricciae]